jgi:peptide/nickel transport system permease protein
MQHPYSVSNLIVIKTPYLRESFQKSGKKVSEIIGNTLPSTAIPFAIVIAIVFGILFGIISALHKDTWIDRLIALVSTLGMSIPSFYLLGYLGLSYINTLI